MRMKLLLFFSSVGLAITPLELLRAQEYSITDIGLPGGSFSRAQGINNHGVVVGRLTSYMFTWTDGVLQAIAPLGMTGSVLESSINDAGMYCGTLSATGYQHGFANSTDLGTGRAYDINNRNHVTGWNLTGAFVYRNGNFEYLPENKWGTEPLAINDSDHVVGYYVTSGDPFRSEPFIYKDSVLTLLGRLDGTEAEANDINLKGQIVGWSSITPDDMMFRGFIWYNGHWTIIPTLGGNGSEANAINDYGVVVGEVKNASNAPRAFVYDTLQGLRDLNNLISAGSGWELWGAYDINNAGQIVGVGFVSGNPYLRGFLLTPTAISIVNPTAGERWIAGEQDTIRWTGGANIDSVRLWFTTTTDDSILQFISGNYPASAHEFVWDVPADILSRNCVIRIEDADDPNRFWESPAFTIRGYELARIGIDGNYERYLPDHHGWSFSNSEDNMWPPSWWTNFDYDNDLDPFTNHPYPPEIANYAVSSDFPDWPLFVKTFGFENCYFQTMDSSFQYRQAAIQWWSAHKGIWGGSCFGFATTSYLTFDYLPEFDSRFPEIGTFSDLYSLLISDINRKIINENFLYQFGRVSLEHRGEHDHTTPSQTLEDLKQMLLSDDRNEMGLILYNQGSGGGAHIINPYRAEKFGGDPSFWWIYVYDSNIPGDITQRVFINTLSDTWSYSGLNWSGNAGLFLTNPIWNYLVNPIARHHSSGPQITSVQVFSNPFSSILIKDAMGNSIGYADSSLIDNMDNAFPIIPIVGREHPPIGYDLPVGEYSVSVSNFSDSLTRVSFHTDSLVCSYRRLNARPNDSDFVYFRDGTMTLANPDSIVKPSLLQYVMMEEEAERSYTLAVSQTPGDSLRVSPVSDQNLLITKLGLGTSYNLKIHYASYQVSGQFEHDNIVLQPNTSHQLVPQWNDFQQPVKILIDTGNDGIIDDSIFVENEVTDVQDQSLVGIPGEFKLHQNYPNPFNPSTTITYQLPLQSYVTLKIYNVLGQEVVTLVNEELKPGIYKATWDATRFSSGIYLCVFKAGSFTESRKLVLIR